MRNTLALALVLLGALLACKSKSSGTVTVDGTPFVIDECKSGQANEPKFIGVDFLDKSGRRVRFYSEGTGTIRTFIFNPGATQGEMIGEGCGNVVVTTQNSEVNGVKNVSGSVTANCTGGGHTIVANATFENCH
jgi:hypothetical protein